MWIKGQTEFWFLQLRLRTIFLGFCLLLSCNHRKTDVNDYGIEHVIVIGFDGMSPDGIAQADTPNFDKVMNEGAYTMQARAVMPTSSSPNWASMIMGAGPEQHGITSNDWEKDNFILPSVVYGEGFLFPTIFNLIDRQYKNAEIGAIYHWEGFGRLFEKSAVDFDVHTESEEETAKVGSKYIEEKSPTFAFIHFDHVDHAGHEYGHGSKEYYQAVEKADVLLGQILMSIEKAGIQENTLVVISADHGGVGKGHGGETLNEIEIPFLIWGKGVKSNYKVNLPVYQYDNAATVAYALGLKPPAAWIGKPVKSAFSGNIITDEFPLVDRLKQPQIGSAADTLHSNGGLFNERVDITIRNPNSEGAIRYTVDGTMPTGKSQTYSETFQLSKNTVIKSGIFKENILRSPITEASFRIKSESRAKPVLYEVYYLSDLINLPPLENLKFDRNGACFEFSSNEIKDMLRENTVVRFVADIAIENPGTYQFYLRSDDGSRLYINDKVVVDNDGEHGVVEKSGKISLQNQVYSMKVNWFNGGGDGFLEVYYQSDVIPKQILPTTVLSSGQ